MAFGRGVSWFLLFCCFLVVVVSSESLRLDDIFTRKGFASKQRREEEQQEKEQNDEEEEQQQQEEDDDDDDEDDNPFHSSSTLPFKSPPLTPLQEKFHTARNAGLTTQRHQASQREDSFHSPSCLGTQYVQIPRGCPQQRPKIVSFPKSGRTWMRCIVSSMDFASKNKNISRIGLQKLDSHIKDSQFSHEDPHPYYLTKTTAASLQSEHFHPDIPVILLVRDPRDVAVSNYHEVVHRHGWYSFRGHLREVVRNMTLSEFLRFDYGSFQTNVAMINTWASYRGGNCPRMVLYYENMQSEECWENEYHKLATFLGRWLSKSQLFQVRERCSFDHLKKEVEHGKGKKNLGARWNLRKKGKEDTAKIRKGKVGGYVEEMTREDIEWAEERAFFVGEFMEYDSRYRGTVEMSEREMEEAMEWWKTT